MENKKVKIFNDHFEETLTDIPHLKFLEFEEEDLDRKSNQIEVNGSDGVLQGPMNFGPFNLILRFSYKGMDYKEYRLAKEKLRQLINRRDPYFVWHSDMPGKKYAVIPEGVSNENLTSQFGLIEVIYSAYKGYAESLKDTSEFSWTDESWQFEQGIIGSDEVKYKHNIRYFKIFNGSKDTINPLLRHKLNINCTLTAPYGFEIVNLTTNDIFEYKKPLKKRNTVSIIGVHPYINNKRVGKDTNYDFITLAPGWNEILIRGHNISNSPKTEFIFNYIYR
ncbi:phage tail domain-containing protein [Staphylococcus epidermidis]|uniref:phage tail domain-containing protein n=1 Tax=Staphylococcus epidermidis TaxID=1282 RepID=UPI0008E9E34A|nr:phage tail domain-containing protein [Staphylococcus epidermidis]MDU6061307.1 phage tail family protein [Veillonella sp.]MBC8789313.1 phage tail family protein [Staphylococcus epidermidis]MBM0797580.1 phage tail family protein [Staphylococcus epidermidis]MBM0838491.1 phage tail family protein [Staphylococcus epidermidis]MBM0872915.1 phage tail family protein [Staphylococcus epidermidis]